jgi:hypothetical protein
MVTKNNNVNATGTTPAVAPYTITFSHTVNSNANRYIVVNIACTSGTIVSVTCGGVTMSQLKTTNNGSYYVYSYGMIAPGTGSQSIVITGSAGLEYMVYNSQDFYNVNQSNPTDATNSWSGTIAHGSNHSTNLVTTWNNSYLFDYLCCNYTGVTLTCTQTNFQNQASTMNLGAGSYAGVKSAGTTAFQWNNTSSATDATAAQVLIALREQNNKTFITDGIIKMIQTKTFTEDGVISYPTGFYTNAEDASLAATDADRTNIFAEADYVAVATNDGTEKGQAAKGDYSVFLFKDKNANSTDTIAITWKGQTNLSPALSPVLLQVYNRNTPGWETLSTYTTATIGSDFQMTGSVSSNLSYYYDSAHRIACRVYQKFNA